MRLRPAQKYTPFPSSIVRSGLWASLSPSAKAVYVCLLDRSDGNTSRCWPSYTTIAADAGVSRKSAINAVESLRDLGLLVVCRRTGVKGDPESNLYTMMVPDDDIVTRCNDYTTPGVIDTPPQCSDYTTPSVTITPERNSIERNSFNEYPTGSANAEAPVEPTEDTLPDTPKPDPYQAVLDVYEGANMLEPPRCEITPLLRAMKQALASGWQPTRIAAAWVNARNRGNPQVWSLAYTLRHLTEAEAMKSKPPCGKSSELSSDERRSAARDAVMNAFGGALNER